MDTSLLINDLPDWFWRICATCFGLAWGSFLNVVIYRVPLGKSVVTPGSHCPACGKPIRAWQNIPVISYLMLGGRAGCCGVRIPPRYVAVEVIVGLLALAIVETQVLSMGTKTALAGGCLFLTQFALGASLIAAAFIDLEHLYIPLTIPASLLGLGLATLGMREVDWKDALIAAGGGMPCVARLACCIDDCGNDRDKGWAAFNGGGGGLMERIAVYCSPEPCKG
jgi:leader peptidase (prepilin peptidase)/N-methyltransferase